MPQTPGLLLYPFVALWEWLIGLDGIILYARHLHLFFSAAIALLLFVALRRILDDPPSAPCSQAPPSRTCRSGFTASATTPFRPPSSQLGCSSA